jgi:flagellar biosynthesis GTPase FlhF
MLHMTLSEESAKDLIEQTKCSISLPLYKRFYQSLANQIQWRLPHDYRKVPHSIIDYDEYLLYEAEKDIEAISKDRRLIEFGLLPQVLKQQAKERYESDDLINQSQMDSWYRKACLQYHPDKSAHPREIFQTFSAEYRRLKVNAFMSESQIVETLRLTIVVKLLSAYTKRYIGREAETQPIWAARAARLKQALQESKERTAMAWEEAEQATRAAEQATREEEQATRELEQATLEAEQSAREAEASLAEAAQSWQDIKSTCQAIEQKCLDAKQSNKWPATLTIHEYWLLYDCFLRLGEPFPTPVDWQKCEEDFIDFVCDWWPNRTEANRQATGFYNHPATTIQHFFKKVVMKQPKPQSEPQAEPPPKCAI